MEQGKVKFLKEKELASSAEKNYDKIVSNGYAQNPISAKFLAFKKTKKEIKPKDIL